jgi:hypothetical protein
MPFCVKYEMQAQEGSGVYPQGVARRHDTTDQIDSKNLSATTQNKHSSNRLIKSSHSQLDSAR